MPTAATPRWAWSRPLLGTVLLLQSWQLVSLFLQELWWPATAGANFILLASLVGIPSAAFAWLARQRRLALILSAQALAILPCLVSYLPSLPAASADAPASAELRLLSWNLLAARSDRAASAAWLQEQALAAEPSDVILLLEVDAAWLASLQDLLPLYPHRRLADREDNYGLLLLSRLPLQGRVEHHQGIPYLDVQLQTAAGPCRLLGLHTLPPLGSEGHRASQALLASLAASLDPEQPTIVAGDLNAAPGSAWLSRLQRAGGLRRAALGGPWAATWGPPGLPCLLQLDHVLATQHWRLTGGGLGPRLGSDHRPLALRLQLR